MIESMKSQNQNDILELLEPFLAQIFSQNIMPASCSDQIDKMADVCIV